MIYVIKSVFSQDFLDLLGSLKIIMPPGEDPSYVGLPHFFIKVFHRPSCFKVMALPARSNRKLYDSIESIES